MHLADAFIQSDLQSIHAIHVFLINSDNKTDFHIVTKNIFFNSASNAEKKASWFHFHFMEKSSQDISLNIFYCILWKKRKANVRLIFLGLYIYIYISGGPLSALTCCVNGRLVSGDKKNIAVNLFSKLGWELGLYYASYDDFHPDILARMYT